MGWSENVVALAFVTAENAVTTEKKMAKVFMGDCGSMTFGFALSGLALMSARGAASDLFLAVLVPIAILGLPIFDTTLVTIVRRLNGRPVTLGGRDHLSHRLVALGLSERGADCARPDAELISQLRVNDFADRKVRHGLERSLVQAAEELFKDANPLRLAFGLLNLVVNVCKC